MPLGVITETAPEGVGDETGIAIAERNVRPTRRHRSYCIRANARTIRTDSLHDSPRHGSRSGSRRPPSPSTRAAPSPRPQVSGHPCPLHSTRGAFDALRLDAPSRDAPRTSARGAASTRVGPRCAVPSGNRRSSRSARSRSVSRGRRRDDTRRGRTGSDERRAQTSGRKLDVAAITCETNVVARVYAVTEGSEL